MKVGITIVVFNLDARVFLLQIESIKRFCRDEDYELIVVDNSTDEELADNIKYHAGQQNVTYKKTIPVDESPSRSHAFALNFAYEKLKDDYDIIVFFDHDLIPVKDFSAVEILGEKVLAGVSQGKKVKYLWPGCLFIANNKVEKELVRFNPVSELRLDTGGEMHEMISKSDVVYFDEIGVNNPHIKDKYYYFYIMIHNRTFLHMLNCSNWRNVKGNETRINSLINIVNELNK